MSFIENLQNKPRKTRLLILWTASISVMLVIIVVWLASFSQNSKPADTKDELEQTQLPSLFESFKQDISTFKEALDASVNEIEEQTSSIEDEGQTTQ